MWQRYATRECVGQLGDISVGKRDDTTLVVESMPHTYFIEHKHRLTINRVGIMLSSERQIRTQYGIESVGRI